MISEMTHIIYQCLHQVSCSCPVYEITAIPKCLFSGLVTRDHVACFHSRLCSEGADMELIRVFSRFKVN